MAPLPHSSLSTANVGGAYQNPVPVLVDLGCGSGPPVGPQTNEEGVGVFPPPSPMFLTCESLGIRPRSFSGRGLALGHGAIVEERRQHAADDRAQDVQPRAREVSRHEHRP
jgi:hypothetical protein